MTYHEKVLILALGELNEWKIWAIHIVFPFFYGLIGFRNTRHALAMVVLSYLIWLGRILHAASLDWPDIQERIADLTEDNNEIPY